VIDFLQLRNRRLGENEQSDFTSTFNLRFSFSVIPQTCRYKSKKYECGLSISCVLNGGKPMDLCSGGMIWSCCVDLLTPGAQDEEISQAGSINNASE
jgi:hypothetical protein